MKRFILLSLLWVTAALAHDPSLPQAARPEPAPSDPCVAWQKAVTELCNQSAKPIKQVPEVDRETCRPRLDEQGRLLLDLTAPAGDDDRKLIEALALIRGSATRPLLSDVKPLLESIRDPALIDGAKLLLDLLSPNTNLPIAQSVETLRRLPLKDPKPFPPLQNVCSGLAKRHPDYGMSPRLAFMELSAYLILFQERENPDRARALAATMAQHDVGGLAQRRLQRQLSKYLATKFGKAVDETYSHALLDELLPDDSGVRYQAPKQETLFHEKRGDEVTVYLPGRCRAEVGVIEHQLIPDRRYNQLEAVLSKSHVKSSHSYDPLTATTAVRFSSNRGGRAMVSQGIRSICDEEESLYTFHNMDPALGNVPEFRGPTKLDVAAMDEDGVRKVIISDHEQYSSYTKKTIEQAQAAGFACEVPGKATPEIFFESLRETDVWIPVGNANLWLDSSQVTLCRRDENGKKEHLQIFGPTLEESTNSRPLDQTALDEAVRSRKTPLQVHPVGYQFSVPASMHWQWKEKVRLLGWANKMQAELAFSVALPYLEGKAADPDPKPLLDRWKWEAPNLKGSFLTRAEPVPYSVKGHTKRAMLRFARGKSEYVPIGIADPTEDYMDLMTGEILSEAQKARLGTLAPAVEGHPDQDSTWFHTFGNARGTDSNIRRKVMAELAAKGNLLSLPPATFVNSLDQPEALTSHLLAKEPAAEAVLLEIAESGQSSAVTKALLLLANVPRTLEGQLRVFELWKKFPPYAYGIVELAKLLSPEQRALARREAFADLRREKGKANELHLSRIMVLGPLTEEEYRDLEPFRGENDLSILARQASLPHLIVPKLIERADAAIVRSDSEDLKHSLYDLRKYSSEPRAMKRMQELYLTALTPGKISDNETRERVLSIAGYGIQGSKIEDPRFIEAIDRFWKDSPSLSYVSPEILQTLPRSSVASMMRRWLEARPNDASTTKVALKTLLAIAPEEPSVLPAVMKVIETTADKEIKDLAWALLLAQGTLPESEKIVATGLQSEDKHLRFWAASAGAQLADPSLSILKLRELIREEYPRSLPEHGTWPKWKISREAAAPIAEALLTRSLKREGSDQWRSHLLSGLGAAGQSALRAALLSRDPWKQEIAARAIYYRPELAAELRPTLDRIFAEATHPDLLEAIAQALAPKPPFPY